MGIYQEYKGGTLDLISSDYTRPEANASEMRNVLFTGSVDDPATEKRFGAKRRAINGPIFGQTEFNNIVNPRTDGKNETVGFFEDGPRRRVDGTLIVNYVGAAPAAWAGIEFDPVADEFRFILRVGIVTPMSRLIGKGYDEVGPETLASLSAAIALIPDFTSSVVGTGTIPAAFLENQYQHDLIATRLEAVAYEWVVLGDVLAPKPSGFKVGPAWAQLAWMDQPDYEPISFDELNNVLYFVMSGRLYKYDGQSVWGAGMDLPALFTTQAASGVLPAGTYNYIVRGRQIDRTGNIVLGPWQYASQTIAASKGVYIDIALVYGLNVRRMECGVTMGSPGNFVTYSFNSLQVGDVATVWDNDTDSLIDTWVVSINAGLSQIEFAHAVQMNDNENASNGLSWEIARQKQGGTVYYYIAERPYGFDQVSSNAWFDEALDVTLAEEVTLPEFDFGPPPGCRYVTVFQGTLVVAGSPMEYRLRLDRESGGAGVLPELQNSVNFGDTENVEGWPSDGSFQIDVETKSGDVIRGIHEVGSSLLVFKQKSIARISGEPTDLNVSVDWLSKEVGCLAGHTITEVNGQLFFLSTRGFATVVEGQAPSEKMGYVIRPIINQAALPFTKQLQFMAGHTGLLSNRQLYICHFPAYAAKATWVADTVYLVNNGEMLVGRIDFTKPVANENSRTFAFDYLRERWVEWALNAQGGMSACDERLAWTDGRLVGGALVNGYFEENIGDVGIMYNDHDKPISFRLGTAWYHGGKPSVFKNMPRIRVSSVPTTIANAPTLDIRQQVNFLRNDYAEVVVDLGIQAPPAQVVAQHTLASGKFKAARFIFENEVANTNVQLEGWEVEVDAPYVSELKT